MWTPGLLILLVFALSAGLMMSRRLPALLALPGMALAIGGISGAWFDWATIPPGGPEPASLGAFLGQTILTEGSSRLAPSMMYGVFGAILSQLVLRAGIAQRLISLAAEYAGERKLLLAALLTGAVALCFTSVSGLGAVIMLGSLALPIMVGAGLSPAFSAGCVLFAVALGGALNPAILGFYRDTLQLSPAELQRYVIAYGVLLGLTTLAFLGIQGARERRLFTWAAPAPPLAPSPPPPGWPALLTPALPILLILGAGVPILPAFVFGLAWGCLTTRPRHAVDLLTAATLEGLKDISPVIGLFMGVGMALNAMTAEPTRAVMAPILGAVIPQTPLAYVAFFTLLAPLALYRGPLNFFGLGAGVAGLILGADLLPPAAVLAAFFAVGQVQGVCDPTNTHSVWIAQFTRTSTEQLLRLTLPYVWVFVLAALTWAVTMEGALGR